MHELDSFPAFHFFHSSFLQFPTPLGPSQKINFKVTILNADTSHKSLKAANPKTRN